MANTFGATVAKRRLSRRLGELRSKNGYTANQVCDKLNWGRGKVGRFEANNWRRPELSDVRDLLRVYSVSEPERAELEQLAVAARQRAWWRDYADIFGESEYPGYEHDSVRICLYMPLILPALLQTEDYARALMLAGTQPEAWQRRALETRRRRQEILARQEADAPELIAVITEASLMYRWGSQEQRRAQVSHLVQMSRRPGVELRMIRFEDGLHPGMSSLISVFDFPGDEPSLVYVENDPAVKEVTDLADVDNFAATFRRIREAALNAPATTAYLKQLVERLE